MRRIKLSHIIILMFLAITPSFGADFPKCNNGISVEDIKNVLHQHAYTLSPALIKTTEAILGCANKLTTLCNNKLTLIDYSLPSSKKRLWVFDLKSKKLLINTYVAHGIKSGISAPNYFTNTLNSKASSLGVFVTGSNYYGRDGLSLRLRGIEKKFNDNSIARAVVMHSAWYVNEDFIRKYGRAGRSWGCPAIPLNQLTPIVDTIKDQSLMLIYYPSDQWLSTSSYLTCDSALLTKQTRFVTPLPEMRDNEVRGDILYGETNKIIQVDANVPVMCMSVSNYQRVFKTKPPLSRMLRKQIYNTEYIALNLSELKQLVTKLGKQVEYTTLEFFLPEMIKSGGRYRTEFKTANLGKVIQLDLTGENPVIVTDKSRITFKPTTQFIRWIGL